MTLPTMPYLEPRPGAETERRKRQVVWLLANIQALRPSTFFWGIAFAVAVVLRTE
jgi:hypothetical protein